MKSPIEQGKDHILTKCLPLVKPHHKKMLIPCYQRDYEDYQKALALPEVREAIQHRGIQAELIIVDEDGEPISEIIIATYEDVRNGRLDRHLRKPGRSAR